MSLQQVASRFLAMFGDRHTFQTFDDSGAKNRSLSRVLHGTLAEHAIQLARLNAQRAGVFVMVNEGDELGRKAANVRCVRALFVDLDGAPLDPVKAAPLPAHCVVESSPGRWHAYWRVADCPLAEFKPLQKALAHHFGGDRSVSDLCRVMRLPGFDHCKGDPRGVRIVSMQERAPYAFAELKLALNVRVSNASSQRREPNRMAKGIAEGERNAKLLSLAGGLVYQGLGESLVNDRLQRINAEHCQPPLCASEVDAIVARAVAYGSDGYARLPHRLLDSPEWKALPPAAHEVILTAYRRLGSTNAHNGNIELTWNSFRKLRGFADHKTFYRHRADAISSGILIETQRGKRTKDGATPSLFAIAPRFLLTESLPGEIPVSAMSQNPPSYALKLSGEALGIGIASASCSISNCAPSKTGTNG